METVKHSCVIEKDSLYASADTMRRALDGSHRKHECVATAIKEF